MWRIYNAGSEGIAICTTFGGLKSAVNLALERVYCGSVRYLDYRSEAIEENKGFMAFMSKRKSFEHEREIRLIHWSVDDVILMNSGSEEESAPGKNIEVDLDKLIDRIYVSPTSQDWFLVLLRKICSTYGITKQVVRSDLASATFF